MKLGDIKEGYDYELKTFGLCKLEQIGYCAYYFYNVIDKQSVCIDIEDVESFVLHVVDSEDTNNHDSVQKPKHYMLIPDQDIEVRDETSQRG